MYKYIHTYIHTYIYIYIHAYTVHIYIYTRLYSTYTYYIYKKHMCVIYIYMIYIYIERERDLNLFDLHLYIHTYCILRLVYTITHFLPLWDFLLPRRRTSSGSFFRSLLRAAEELEAHFFVQSHLFLKFKKYIAGPLMNCSSFGRPRLTPASTLDKEHDMGLCI